MQGSMQIVGHSDAYEQILSIGQKKFSETQSDNLENTGTFGQFDVLRNNTGYNTINVNSARPTMNTNLPLGSYR